MDDKTFRNVGSIIGKTQKKQKDIQQDILRHIGKYAILLEKSGRHSFSFFVQITGKCTAKYKCYDYEGKFRCYLEKYLDVIQIMIGEQQLIYLDDI